MNFGEGMERLERWLLAMGLKKVSFLLKVLKVLLKNIYPDVEYFSFLYIFIFLLMFFFKRMLILRSHVKKLKFFELF